MSRSRAAMGREPSTECYHGERTQYGTKHEKWGGHTSRKANVTYPPNWQHARTQYAALPLCICYDVRMICFKHLERYPVTVCCVNLIFKSGRTCATTHIKHSAKVMFARGVLASISRGSDAVFFQTRTSCAYLITQHGPHVRWVRMALNIVPAEVGRCCMATARH